MKKHRLLTGSLSVYMLVLFGFSHSASTQTNLGSRTTATQVAPAATTTLEVTPNPVFIGSPITFTAVVAGTNTGPTPTGTVTFNYAYGGAIPISPPVAVDGSGVATFTTSTLGSLFGPGNYEISATYSGDTNYSGSASQPLWEDIIAAPGASITSGAQFGTVNIGNASSVIPVNVTFNSSVTLAIIAVLTKGNPDLDFTNA
jgi:hypothetical protein